MSGARRVSIRNGRLIDPANGIDEQLDLHIEDGRVKAVGSAPSGFRAEQSIAADGQVVCPGLIDLWARLREPGEERKATIASETVAAAAGGITTLCCPPDTQPVIDTPAVAEMIRQHAERVGRAANRLPVDLGTGASGTELEVDPAHPVVVGSQCDAHVGVLRPFAHERHVTRDAVRGADGDTVQGLEHVRLPATVGSDEHAHPGTEVQRSVPVRAEVDELEPLDAQRGSAHPHRHEEVGQVVDLAVLVVRTDDRRTQAVAQLEAHLVRPRRLEPRE